MQMYDWMSSIDSTRLLSQITMPGSHDAGIFTDEATSKGMVSKSSAVCQDVNVYEQCIAGSRFFDIRLKASSDGIRTYHLSAIGGALGQSSESILSNVYTFLERNPSELVILRFTKPKGESDEIVKSLLHSSLKKRLYTSSTFKNFARSPISELRGKALCVFEPESFKSLRPQDGLHPFCRYGGGKTQYGIVACGKYSNSAALREVIDGQVGKIDEHAGHSSLDHLFVLYWTQTFNPGHIFKKGRFKTDIRGLAFKARNPDKERQKQRVTGGAHHNMDYLKDLLAMGQDKFGKNHLKVKPTTLADRQRIMPNVVMYDFVNIETSRKIVALNEPVLMGHLIEDEEALEAFYG
jgi:hypothetical protein